MVNKRKQTCDGCHKIAREAPDQFEGFLSAYNVCHKQVGAVMVGGRQIIASKDNWD